MWTNNAFSLMLCYFLWPVVRKICVSTSVSMKDWPKADVVTYSSHSSRHVMYFAHLLLDWWIPHSLVAGYANSWATNCCVVSKWAFSIRGQI